MSSVEAFVLVPHEKFNAMEDELRQRTSSTQSSSTPMDTAEDVPAANSNSVNQENETLGNEEQTLANETVAKLDNVEKPSLSAAAKHIVKSKSAKKRTFHKFIRAIEMFSDDKLDLPNISALVTSALNQSKKILENEEQFYAYLLHHNLFYMVTILILPLVTQKL